MHGLYRRKRLVGPHVSLASVVVLAADVRETPCLIDDGAFGAVQVSIMHISSLSTCLNIYQPFALFHSSHGQSLSPSNAG